jgi:hypothetical protein
LVTRFKQPFSPSERWNAALARIRQAFNHGTQERSIARRRLDCDRIHEIGVGFVASEV